MALRITSGILKGMTVKTPDQVLTRPTLEKVRQAVLNMLAPDFAESRFLDLFAGSGAMGLEAFSRGAHQVVFVEKDRAAASCLRNNLDEAKRRVTKQGLASGVFKILDKDLNALWSELKREGPFDIIWADPPYEEVSKWLPVFAAKLGELVHERSQFVLESEVDAAQLAPDFLGTWSLLKQKKYGRTYISVFIVITEK